MDNKDLKKRLSDNLTQAQIESKAAAMKQKHQDALNMMKALSGKPEKEEEQ